MDLMVKMMCGIYLYNFISLRIRFSIVTCKGDRKQQLGQSRYLFDEVQLGRCPTLTHPQTLILLARSLTPSAEFASIERPFRYPL